jgi:hypothetical protein
MSNNLLGVVVEFLDCFLRFYINDFLWVFNEAVICRQCTDDILWVIIEGVICSQCTDDFLEYLLRVLFVDNVYS